MGGDDLTGRLGRWTAHGLITCGQAGRILADERARRPEPGPRIHSPAAEGLGYVGGVPVLVAAGTWLRDLILLALGAITTLLTVPPALGRAAGFAVGIAAAVTIAVVLLRVR
ncbi:hypothetical protein [Amycolatopsis thermoflava]|uniref:hypothetical protein n=1 Tax=Amycolatopsis thermoflava TaxID=84480 RepID=UPI003656C728